MRAIASVMTASPTPSPSGPSAEPSPSAITEQVGEVGDAVGDFVTWFTGAPLRILVILLAGSIALMVLRRLIGSVSEHLAEGTPFYQRGMLRPLGQTEMGAVLQRANPLATARRAQRSRTIGSVLHSAATITVGSIMLLLVLDQLNVNLGPFLASLGVVGVAVGIGAQSVVKDFLAGIFILLEDQYGVGDVVDLGPATGTIEAVALRVTKLRDADGTLWYVPNGTLTRVGNHTQEWARAVVEVEVDYFADISRVQTLLGEAAAKVAADPVVGSYLRDQPLVTGLEDLSAEAVTLQVAVKTSPAMQWEVARQLRWEVRHTLEEAGIPLGGQRDLLAQHQGESASASPTPPGGRVDAGPADGPSGPSAGSGRPEA
ncbi:mechanosensitive ion channel family protein [Cellulomonas chengniuliangii]|uniref:mechanosensitive ion channel family protein n=1 Tax=Cellulomonas chengniuliangii TaxID=2968084 RepID=UPI001D0EF16E|nr:mechanosensitive ion channel family protein [Cellulomonas chengniuliangii]MCC2319470.1 mechanosensitive ion channel family protein [Cellulomonas chengniuliangii]